MSQYRVEPGRHGAVELRAGKTIHVLSRTTARRLGYELLKAAARDETSHCYGSQTWHEWEDKEKRNLKRKLAGWPSLA